MTFRLLRIFVLLTLLLLAGGVTAWDQYIVRGWQQPLRVEIYPLIADAQADTRTYVAGLTPADFAGIGDFLSREARRFGFTFEPSTELELAPASRILPPAQPAGHSAFENIRWSLGLRWWAYRHSASVLPSVGRVRLFVLYRQPPEDGHMPPHSLGLQKGLIGVVHAWAKPEYTARNALVMTHELLHTLGATDKYAPGDLLPVYPDGYADPQRKPLYPQAEAEIMAGRIPRDADHAIVPAHLEQTRMGAATAREVGFDAAFRRHWSGS